MSLRRIATLLLVALLLVVSGCGGDDGGDSKSAASLDDLLAYLPQDTPFAVTVTTDPKSDQVNNAQQILNKFPFAGQVRSELKEGIESDGQVSFDTDIKPLLGGEAIIALPNASEFAGDNVETFLGAVATKDGEKLKKLILKDGKTKEIGKKDGATLFQSDGDEDVFAVDGSTLLAGTNRQIVEAALDRKDGDHLTREKFDQAFEGLPQNPAARFYFDTQAFIRAIPEASAARNIKYIAASRPTGGTLNFRADKIEVDSHGKTEGLTEDDLPFAPGDESPGVIRVDGEVGFGWRDAARTIRFYEETAKVAAPAQYGEYLKQKGILGAALDVDFDKEIVDQLSGNTYASVGFAGYSVRSDIEDPDAMRATLKKLAKSKALGDLKISDEGDDMYRVIDDGQTVFVGVAGDSFVVGPTKARAQGFATLEPQPVDGAKGAFAVFADGEKLANQIAEQSGQGMLGSFFTGPIGELKGWAGNDPSGSRSHFELGIDG